MHDRPLLGTSQGTPTSLDCLDPLYVARYVVRAESGRRNPAKVAQPGEDVVLGDVPCTGIGVETTTTGTLGDACTSTVVVVWLKAVIDSVVEATSSPASASISLPDEASTSALALTSLI